MIPAIPFSKPVFSQRNSITKTPLLVAMFAQVNKHLRPRTFKRKNFGFWRFCHLSALLIVGY